MYRRRSKIHSPNHGATCLLIREIAENGATQVDLYFIKDNAEGQQTRDMAGLDR